MTKEETTTLIKHLTHELTRDLAKALFAEIEQAPEPIHWNENIARNWFSRRIRRLICPLIPTPCLASSFPPKKEKPQS